MNRSGYKINMRSKNVDVMALSEMKKKEIHFENTDAILKNKNVTRHPIIGTICCIIAVAIIVGCIIFIIRYPVCEICRETTSNVLLQKQYELLHSYIEMDDWKTILSVMGALLLIGISGLMAGLIDDALCLLPFGSIVRDKFEVKFPKLVRYIPAFILTVYLSIHFAFIELMDGYEYKIQTFSWTGQGYTPGMWFSQISIFLAIAAIIIISVEAFCRSGFYGIIIRVPLLVFSNIALAVFSSYFVFIAFFALAFIVVAIVMALASKSLFKK